MILYVHGGDNVAIPENKGRIILTLPKETIEKIKHIAEVKKMSKSEVVYSILNNFFLY